MSDTKIKTSNIGNLAVTHALLHTDMDLTGKTVQVAAPSSNTHPATKLYVDTEVANLIDSAPDTLNTLNELAAAVNDDANFNATIASSIATKLPLSGGTMTGNITFGDDDKAIFGAGSDLQIYHQTSNGNSIIKETGGGILSLQTNGPEASFYDITNDALMARFINGGKVQLNYNGNNKIETTSTGVDVTGAVTADGIFVDTDSIYSVSGTNRVGINKTSPATTLDVGGSIFFSSILRSTTGGSEASPSIQPGLDGDTGMFWPAVNNIGFTTAGTERMRINNLGNVGIGESTPSHRLHINGGSNDEARVRVTNTANGQASLDLDNSEGYFRTYTDAGEYRIYDQTDGTHRLVIDTSGNVGIGTTSPSFNLDVKVGSGAGGAGRIQQQAVTNSVAASNGVFVVEGTEGQIQVMAEDSGSWASNITLSNVPSSGTNKHWTMHHTPVTHPTISNALQFNYVEANDPTYIGGDGTGADSEAKFTITNDGKVGIGTETPGSKLTVVSGTSRLNGGSVKIGRRNITGGLFLHSDVSTSSHYNWMITTQDTVNQGFEIIPSSAPGNIEFSNPAFVITGDDRNVGIGTSGPSAKLDVRTDQSYANGASYSSTQTLPNPVNLTLKNSDTGGSRMNFGNSTSDSMAVIQTVIRDQGSGSFNDADLRFSTTQDGVLTDRLNIARNSVEIQNGLLRLANLASPPTPDGSSVGGMYYNTTDGIVYHWNGVKWVTMSNVYSASGGTESTATIGGTLYQFHVFTSSGTFVSDATGYIDIFLAAGGGGGGADNGAGGGAGGFIQLLNHGVNGQNYPIVIGGGGAASIGDGYAAGSSGTDTTGFGYTAIGGGRAGSQSVNALSGGSGGGGSWTQTSTTAGAGTSGQGNAGGGGTVDGAQGSAGGGGGASAVGQKAGTMRNPGNGGAGANISSYVGTSFGDSGWFSGGGSGGLNNADYYSEGTFPVSITAGQALGGQGGGGDVPANRQWWGNDGDANTGGGGAGGAHDSTIAAGTRQHGGNGGSGIVIIRYAL